MEAAIQYSPDQRVCNDLEFANFVCDIDLAPEIANLALERGSRGQDKHTTEPDVDPEIEGIEWDDRCAPSTFNKRRDNPVSQAKTTEVLFDDGIVIMNSRHQNSITRFQLGETLPPGNVRTWGPRLVAKWCMQLAKQGSPRAQFRLGCMYALGFGVQRNYIMAYTWCKISAMQHSSGALLKLKVIEPNLTTTHIDYAKKLSRQYYKKYVVPFADK